PQNPSESGGGDRAPSRGGPISGEVPYSSSPTEDDCPSADSASSRGRAGALETAALPRLALGPAASTSGRICPCGEKPVDRRQRARSRGGEGRVHLRRRPARGPAAGGLAARAREPRRRRLAGPRLLLPAKSPAGAGLRPRRRLPHGVGESAT